MENNTTANWVGFGVGALAGGGVAFAIGHHCQLDTLPLVGVTVGGAVAGGAAGYFVGGALAPKSAAVPGPVQAQPIPQEACDIPG